MTTLVSTAFTGADGASWPSPWTNNGGTATIQSNRGQITSPATAWTGGEMRANVTAATGRIDATVRFPAVPGNSARINVRWDPAAGNGYRLIIPTDYAGFQLVKVTGFAETPLSEEFVSTWAAGTDYRVAVEWTGSTIRAKKWLASGSEPSGWNLVATDSAYSTGDVSLVALNNADGLAVSVLWDDVTIVDTAVVGVRHNLSPNPKAGTNATGWTGTALGAGGRVTGLTGFPSGVTTGVHYQAAGYIQTPTATGISAGQRVTLSFYLKNGTGFNETGKTMYLAFTRSAGGDDFSNTTSVAFPTGAVTRLSHTAVAPANATGAYLLLDGLNADYDVSAHLAEVAALDSYFDGDSTNASWDGTAQDSASTFDDSVTTTPVTSDLDIRYRVANRVTSDVDLRYRVANRVTSDLDLRYRVAGLVISDLDLRYRVASQVHSDLSIKYRVGDVSTDGYDLPEILDALAALYDGLEVGDSIGGVPVTLQAIGMVPGQVNVPAAVFEVDNLTWDISMGRGADTFDVIATLLWQDEDSDSAQRSLLSFLSKRATSGAGRMKAALEGDQTLGGLVSYAIMSRVRDIGTQTYNGEDYLGAQIVIEVVT